MGSRPNAIICKSSESTNNCDNVRLLVWDPSDLTSVNILPQVSCYCSREHVKLLFKVRRNYHNWNIYSTCCTRLTGSVYFFGLSKIMAFAISMSSASDALLFPEVCSLIARRFSLEFSNLCL